MFDGLGIAATRPFPVGGAPMSSGAVAAAGGYDDGFIEPMETTRGFQMVRD
jgi:hypothetical protein